MKWLVEYFNLSKSERNGTIILIVILILVIFSQFFIDDLIPEPQYNHEKFDKLVARIEAHKDSLKALQVSKISNKSKSKPSPVYFNFDPNKISKEDLIRLGVSPNVAQTLINYRKKGGKFFKKKDILKIYGLDKELYTKLEPYIQLKGIIKEKYHENKTDSQVSRLKNPIADSSQGIKTIVELNSADTSQLLSVRGIGPVYSKRILAYRKLLGGFVRKSQLLEVYGLDSNTYNKVNAKISIDTSQVRKISLKNSTFKQLLKHPYLKYADVLAIVTYKESKGDIKNVDELLKNKIIDKKTFKKVEPYLKP